MAIWKPSLTAAMLMAALWTSGCARAQIATGTRAADRVSSAPFTAYANDKAEVVLSRGGEEYLRFNWALWGPNWAWTGLDGPVKAQNGVSSGELSGKLGGTQAPVSIRFRAEKTGPRTLTIRYSARVEVDSPLTLIVAQFQPGKSFDGRQAQVSADGGDRAVKIPFEKQGLGDRVRTVTLSDAANRATTLRFEPPIDIASDGSARIVLASGELKAGQERAVSISVELPEDV